MLGVLLAAGRGTRMKSDRPKVLFTVNDEPMAVAPYRLLLKNCDMLSVVIGYGGSDVKAALLERAKDFAEDKAEDKTLFVTQQELKGTGDAVRTALEGFFRSGRKFENGEEVLILNGDLPLIRSQSLDFFIKECRKRNLESACMSFITNKPAGFGRINRDMRGVFTAIREEKDATPEEKKIKEVNSGVYYFKGHVLSQALEKINNKNNQNEFYITDTLGSQTGYLSDAIICPFKWDLSGVNNNYELTLVRTIAQARLQKHLSEEMGVSFADPLSVFVSARAQFSGPCSLGSNLQILGKTIIGKNVEIVGSSLIQDSILHDGAFVDFSCVIRNSEIEGGARVGPFAHLRPQSYVEEGAKVGNFVELKNTRLGKNVKVNHLSYLGDAQVGEDANIGCGTITCNYDGVLKHKTVIGKGAFIGSDTQLVAPIIIGDEAYVASGTTVTEDVPAGALALSRPELLIKEGYASRLKARLNMKKNSRGEG